MVANPNRKNRQRKVIGIWMIIIAVFFMELMAYTWGRVHCIRLGYDISAAIGRQKELQLLQSKLKIELAHLKSPERLTRIAIDRLGLGKPKLEQIIILP